MFFVFKVVRLSDWYVLNESFDRFVGGEAELAIEFGSCFVAVFGALPEEAFVVAHKWCAFHL